MTIVLSPQAQEELRQGYEQIHKIILRPLIGCSRE